MEVIKTIGRRKTAVARAYLSSGKGEIKVNNRDFKEYFPSEVLQIIVKQPLVTTEQNDNFNISINVFGGGLSGQAEAIRLSIARALVELDQESRPALKAEGFLTRDSRMVERKKYGRRKARRAFQFSKR
ncbi:MAG: 30S ribosomal protein S9 [Cytophagales bacterium]|jgi:small subunit ribosomal protein S9|nr:30S ribosomal protein S9 [Flammeovirgaceae bacterium]MDA7854212.1 30S ribosomal protein S9 [Cyclobacteriaceae bacterium]MDA9906718.1 30S ribosomal protein S9 [Cyclobacteriaceae bacterium]MDB4314802.1 30S ribosomal protein S9 [Cyclobacteriaceae bacterium]MDC6484037.1 30S ribosomal protein S9 [Cyclobacteriaceae bacterium]|tara:strand:- start:231 stop:617 length:387 start_codon:yes stop_codon:yes gene_type:complete